ncbi:MAG: hypothetical protein K2P53_03235 [Rickettsiales bacterium]|jgi:predicted transcriptional regulator|nr:hypothetical protein [Rickettsiales bacterium]
MVIKLSEILKKIEIKNSGYVKSWKEESIFMELDTKDSITGHKLDTKSLQLDTKDSITGHKLDTKSLQLDTKDKNSTKLTKNSTKLTKNSAKLIPITSLNLLSDNEKILAETFVRLISEQSKKQNILLSKQELSSFSGIKIGSIKTTLKRLIDKGLIKRKKFDKGGAYAKAEYYLRLKLDTKLDTKLLSSINNSNKEELLLLNDKEEYAETIKHKNWDDINIEPLRKHGLNQGHLVDIREFNLLDRKVVQESIYHFAYALEENKIKYDNPIGVFVGRLCKGKGWFEAEYISEKDRSLKQLLLLKKQKKKEREEVINELVEVEYEGWKENLSKEETMAIEEKLPKEAKTGHSVVKNFYWKEYYAKEILVPRLEKEGVLVEEGGGE